MSGCFRQRVIAFFLERKPPNERLARNMLDWTLRGFSATTRSEFRPAPRKHARRSPSTSLGPTAARRPARGVRPPVSLQNLLLDEGGMDTVVYRAPYSDYFHTDTKAFPYPTRGADSFAPMACTPRAAAARGPAALTSSASLPRAGSATIHSSHPSASVCPTSRSPSCRCRPSTAAPHGPA